MSHVQYRLFKACLSRPADKKVIYLVATVQHESLCLDYIGHRQAWGVDFGNTAVIFSPADDLEYLHEVKNPLQ